MTREYFVLLVIFNLAIFAASAVYFNHKSDKHTISSNTFTWFLFVFYMVALEFTIAVIIALFRGG